MKIIKKVKSNRISRILIFDFFLKESLHFRPFSWEFIASQMKELNGFINGLLLGYKKKLRKEWVRNCTAWTFFRLICVQIQWKDNSCCYHPLQPLALAPWTTFLPSLNKKITIILINSSKVGVSIWAKLMKSLLGFCSLISWRINRQTSIE